MILRLTDKLARKVKAPSRRSQSLDDSPLADRSARSFTVQRVQYVIVTNTAALYSTLMLGRGITTEKNLIDRMLGSSREVMADDKMEHFYRVFVALASVRVTFAKAFNPSVTGSMTDLVLTAKLMLGDRYKMLPRDVSFRLNETPLSYLDYRDPREAFLSLCDMQPRSLVDHRSPG